MTARTMALRRGRAQRREERRDTLLGLLARLGTLTGAEQALVVEYTTAELAASDELRRTVQGEQRALQAAMDQTQAAEAAIVETEAEVARLESLLAAERERAERAEADLRRSERRRKEVGAESLRRGRRALEYAEQVRELEREIDSIRAQFGAELLRADQAEAALDALTRERVLVEVSRPARRTGTVRKGPSPAGGGPAVHPARVYPRRNLEDPQTVVTTRQLQVLLLVAHGNTNRAVGSVLGLAETSVASQMLLITRKLRVRDRAHAVAVALAIGLLSLDDIKVPEDANRGYISH